MRNVLRLLAIAPLLASLLCCAPASPSHGIWQGDGTAVAAFDAHSDGAEPFTVQVVFPATSDGAPRPGPFPGAVLIPGGGLGPEHYLWLARALAQGGYVVAVPEEPSDLAILDRQRAAVAHDLLRSDRGLLKGLVTDRVAVMGHSLGGVVAANQAIDGPFSALVLLASYPAASDPVERIRIPSLAVAGLADCQALPADVEAGWKRLPSPSVLVELGGVSHLQFTDDDRPDRASCAPGVDLETAHARIAASVLPFLDFALRGDRGALDRLEQGAYQIAVEAR